MPGKLILALNNSVLGEFPLEKERPAPWGGPPITMAG